MTESKYPKKAANGRDLLPVAMIHSLGGQPKMLLYLDDVIAALRAEGYTVEKPGATG